MKHAVAIVIVALLIITGCSKSNNANSQGAGTSGALSLTTTFNPDPPKQGAEALTVLVKDAEGMPVKGALVKITSSMPSMSMTGPSTTATDNGDGTYSANLSLQYATTWHFIVTASSEDKTARRELVQEVK